MGKNNSNRLAVFGFSQLLIPSLLLLLSLIKIAALESETNRNGECWSKVEQHLFWRATNHTPTPVLLKLMSDYEDFHYRCRAEEKALGSPEALGEALMGKGSAKLSCKYLVWYSPYDGLGNRLISLISTYMLALLTNRVLVVDRHWEIEQVFCEPFLNSSWLLSTGVRTDLMLHSATPFNDWVAAGDKARGDGQVASNPHSLMARVNHENGIKFFCPDELERMSEIPVVLLDSNQYYIAGLYYTKYRAEMERLFPDRIIFTHLARHLLNPSNHLWERITDFYQKNLKTARKRLGLQIRTKEAHWRREKSDRLDRCAQTNGLLPKPQPNVESGGVVPAYHPSGRTLPPDNAAFVATLRREFYELLKNNYMKSPLEGGKRVVIRRATRAKEQASSDLTHNEDALLDIWLLSFCDNLITSQVSTFGYVAAGLLGEPPIVLNGILFDDATEDQNPTITDCSAAVSPEPCFHNPPWNVECPGGFTFKDPWHQEPSLRQCDDWPRGVQVAPR